MDFLLFINLVRYSFSKVKSTAKNPLPNKRVNFDYYVSL